MKKRTILVTLLCLLFSLDVYSSELHNEIDELAIEKQLETKNINNEGDLSLQDTRVVGTKADSIEIKQSGKIGQIDNSGSLQVQETKIECSEIDKATIRSDVKIGDVNNSGTARISSEQIGDCN